MILTDGNLSLRPIRSSDAELILKYANNKKLADNLRDYFPHPYTIEDAHAYIKMISEQEVLSNFVMAIDDEFAGMVGLILQGDVYRFTGELGYWLGEPYWGQGITTKAVKLLTEYAFTELNLKKVIACVFGFNQGSIRVMEKAGYRREGVIQDAVFKKNKFWEEVRFGISNPDFEK